MRSVLRREEKYLINTEKYLKHRAYFDKVLHKDTYTKGEGYIVRSLYFDTLNDLDYNEKIIEAEVRKKVRLRIYDPKSEFALLELKQKQGDYQKKRSLKITRDHAKELIQGNYNVLMSYESDYACEMHAIMSLGNYRPKSIVEYKREAFVAKENSIRLTFDSNIIATENNMNIFDENLCMHPVFYTDKVVFEVKYNGFLLSYIKDVIKDVDKSKLSVSKYCLSRNIGKDYYF